MKPAVFILLSLTLKFLALGVSVMALLGAPPIPSRLPLAFVFVALDLLLWSYMTVKVGIPEPKPEPLPTDCEELAVLANDVTVTRRELAYRRRQLSAVLKIVGGSDDTNT